MKTVKWISPLPTNCDICQQQIGNEFIDGKTKQGPWGFMCPQCYEKHGVGLGTGYGQLYQKQLNGDFVKVKG